MSGRHWLVADALPRGAEHGFVDFQNADGPSARQFAQAVGGFPQTAPARANSLFMFQAMVTSFHSPRTLSRPRSENCRKPIIDLMIPNTGSGICLRSA